MSGGGGIGGDVMGGLGLLGGGVATLMGQPEIGLPMMLGGAGSLIGGNVGGATGMGIGGASGALAGLGADALGGSGALGSALGTGGGSGGLFGGGPAQATTGAGTSPIGTGSLGGWGNLAPGATAPPPVMANPAGGGASPNAINSYLSAGGGGPATTPIDNNALSQSLNAPPVATSAPMQSSSSPQQPGLLQAALGASGSAAQAYGNYISQMNQLRYRPEYAATHSSSVIAPQLNPLAPIQSSPIAPPQLQV